MANKNKRRAILALLKRFTFISTLTPFPFLSLLFFYFFYFFYFIIIFFFFVGFSDTLFAVAELYIPYHTKLRWHYAKIRTIDFYGVIRIVERGA